MPPIQIAALMVLVAAPAIVAILRPGRASGRGGGRGALVSGLWCALAFCVVFLVQELGLVLPKALLPGIDPVLFHNDHRWSGDHPLVLLFQGTGALATLALGAAAAARLAKRRGIALFWFAYHGVTMALAQLVIAAWSPGNDVAVALRAIGASRGTVMALAIGALAIIPLVALALGRLAKAGGWREIGLGAVVGLLLIIPFRVPGPSIEVALFPAIVLLAGVPWAAVGGSGGGARGAKLLVPAVALAGLLAAFHLLLRPGIAF